MAETNSTRQVIETFSNMERRLFRNNVGEGWQGKFTKLPPGAVVLLPSGQRMNASGAVLLEHPRRIAFGLAPGSGDIIGGVSREIHPEHVGERWFVFTSLEDKSEGARVREGQKNWHEMVKMMGGISGQFRNIDEAAALLGGKRK